MTENRPGGPTVLRMILGRQLQALREKAGMSFDQAAAAIYSSPYTIRRMERAEGGLKQLTVKSLLITYGITDPAEIDAFLALARDASKPGWWHSYHDVLPAWFGTFIGLEEAAALIRGYDPQSIPGLLQTPDYARASVRTGFPDASNAEAERRVELRLARQNILLRPGSVRLWLVIDETALRRPATSTGPQVMRAQIDKLIDACGQPNITMQVLPFAAGLHPAMYGPFRIFRFDAPEQPDIVYGESMTSAWYIDKPDETAAYIQALDRISAQAVPGEETVSTLRQIRKELLWKSVTECPLPASATMAGPSRGAVRMAVTAWKPRNCPAAGSRCVSPRIPPALRSSSNVARYTHSSTAPRQDLLTTS